MRKALILVALLGGFALSQDPKPLVIDKTKDRKLENPFTEKVRVENWEKGKHVASFVNAHAAHQDIIDGPKGAYRSWRVRSTHLSNTPNVGWKVVEADGKEWVAFEVKQLGAVTLFNARPAKK